MDRPGWRNDRSSDALFEKITLDYLSVEATIKTLVTKDDLAKVKYDLSKEIGNVKADTIEWMFIFWIGQVGATLAIVFLFPTK